MKKRINIFQRKNNLPSTVWYCLVTNKTWSYKMTIYFYTTSTEYRVQGIILNSYDDIFWKYNYIAMTIKYCKNQFIIERLKVVCSKLLLTLLYIMAWSKKESPVEHYVEREKENYLKNYLKCRKLFFAWPVKLGKTWLIFIMTAIKLYMLFHYGLVPLNLIARVLHFYFLN